MSTNGLPTASELTNFYLEASRHGYASGEKPSLFGHLLPGAKCASYSRGSLHYLDVWMSGPPRADDKKWSFSFTVIRHHLQPIWIMWYNGWHKTNDPELIPFLRRALASVKTFCGGRGPGQYTERNQQYKYVNPDWDSKIKGFSGRDWIEVASGNIYFHTFEGMVLVDLPAE